MCVEPCTQERNICVISNIVTLDDQYMAIIRGWELLHTKCCSPHSASTVPSLKRLSSTYNEWAPQVPWDGQLIRPVPNGLLFVLLPRWIYTGRELTHIDVNVNVCVNPNAQMGYTQVENQRGNQHGIISGICIFSLSMASQPVRIFLLALHLGLSVPPGTQAKHAPSNQNTGKCIVLINLLTQTISMQQMPLSLQ